MRTAHFGSGLPVPRWVSLKADRINVRRGASMEHDVLWTYRREGLPVEVIGEFYTWRRIRDQSGEVGWVKQQMLGARRSVIVTGNEPVAILERPVADAATLAVAKPGLVARLEECDGSWCKVSAQGYDGYVARARLWGVYAHEAKSEEGR